MVDLLLFGWLCCWLNFLLNLFLAHKEGNVIFRTIAFGSLSQQVLRLIFKIAVSEYSFKKKKKTSFVNI